MDIGRCGGPADPPGSRALRRGAVGRHHPCHPDDGRGDGHVIPVAGPPRGGELVEPGPAADGGPLPAQGGLRHLGLLGAGAGGAARHAAVRADPGRQRVQLVLRRDGRRQLADRSRRRAQGSAGQRVRGGRRVVPDDRPRTRDRPGSSARPSTAEPDRGTAWWPRTAACSRSASRSWAPWAANTSTCPWWAWPRPPAAPGTGRWRPTAASSATGTRTSTVRPGPSA